MARNVFSSPRMEENNGLRSKDVCKLYVKMTGPTFGEKRLWEVFQEYGKVLDVYVSEKGWAFVTYEDKRTAQNAITAVNRRNVPLLVSFAHDGQRKNNRHSDTECLPIVRNVGRGHILNNPQFDGRYRPGMFEEAVFQDEVQQPYFTNIQCTVDERGKRISKGTAYISDASDRRSLGRGPFRSDSDVSSHGSQFRNDLDLQHVIQGDVCKHCDRPALKECGVCAMPYCSRRCQLEDFIRHKTECTIPPLVDRKNAAHLEEILKDDKNGNKLQKARNKDASNKVLEKDSKRNADEVVAKNNNHGWSDHSTENSTLSRNHKSKQEVQQDPRQNQRDGSKKTNFERLRNQNENEAARNGRDKIIPSAPDKHQDQEVGNSVAATAEIKDLKVGDLEADTVEMNEKRKLPSNRLSEDVPSAPDSKHRHQEVGNLKTARAKSKDLPGTRESVADTDEINDKRKLPSDRFTKVVITVPEGPFTYWVQSEETAQTSLDVYGAVSAVGASAKESCEPKLGELYIAPFHGDWYRAKVISLQPELKVLFIDYGNEEFCSPADIKKLPESCKNIPPLAFKIKLIPDTSKDYCNLAPEKELSVRPLEGVKEKDAVVVRVEGDEPQSASAVKDLYVIQKLKEGEQGIGKIIKPVGEEDTLVIMLTESLKNDFLEVKHLDELISHLPVNDFKPKIGDLVAAEAEEEGLLDGQWGRAIILAVRNDRYLVRFVDHCLVLRTKNIRKLPRELADIPEFGSKLTILEYKKPVNGNWTQFFKTEGKFPFVVEEANRNKNAIVAIKKGEEKVCRAILSCWSPITDINSVCLKDGIEIIIAFFDLEFIYVRPVSISYIQMFDDLEEDLCKYCETVSPLSSIPPLKSVVACKYSQNSTYYRAQVVEIFKDIIKVYFVDYGNEDTVQLESLKPLRDDLRLYPFMAEKIPLRHLTERDLTPEGTNLLLELNKDKTKLKVKLSDVVPSGIELVMEDGITLNRKLKSFFVQKEKREFIHAPKKETATTECKSESLPAEEHKSEISPSAQSKSASSTHSVPSASTGEVYRIDEHLEYEGLPIGKTVELLVLHKFNDTDFTCCRRDSAALAHCIGTLQEEITAYCSACEEQYRPKEIGELCLAKFEDDGMWYRAVFIENINKDPPIVRIVFIDFGNVADVVISHIRRMVPEFLKTPAVAHLCTLKGSEQMSEAEKAAVADLVEISSFYEANVLGKNKASSYVIEMLHITRALSSQS